MSNAMLCIEIYKFNGTWCFTDKDRELLHEPFVLGIPEIINKALEDQNMYEDNKNYRILFAAREFPACHGVLMRQNEEMGGAWYSCNAQTGWLCPATLKFFDDFPESIYFKLEKL
jgi:hypothetical protein